MVKKMIGNWNCAKSENILQFLNLVEESIQRFLFFKFSYNLLTVLVGSILADSIKKNSLD